MEENNAWSRTVCSIDNPQENFDNELNHGGLIKHFHRTFKSIKSATVFFYFMLKHFKLINHGVLLWNDNSTIGNFHLRYVKTFKLSYR